MVANVMGVNIAKDDSKEEIGKVTKSLYIVSFVASIVIVAIGLSNVFSPQRMLMSVILLLVGFLSAISSSSNAIVEERKKRKGKYLVQFSVGNRPMPQSGISKLLFHKKLAPLIAQARPLPSFLFFILPQVKISIHPSTT